METKSRDRIFILYNPCFDGDSEKEIFGFYSNRAIPNSIIRKAKKSDPYLCLVIDSMSLKDYINMAQGAMDGTNPDYPYSRCYTDPAEISRMIDSSQLIHRLFSKSCQEKRNIPVETEKTL